jgi:hypothetical protein
MAYNTSNITGQGIGNALSNDPSNAYGDAGAVRELWRKGVEVYEQTTDFFAPMEGGSSAIIETITDTTKGRGQKITFTQMAGLYDEPKMGDELFNDENDFESIKIHTYTLSVDYLRHGVRYTERSEEFMGMRGEIAVGIPEQLGKWMGRQKSEKMFMSFLHHGASENQIFSGNKANSNALLSADVLDWDTIVASNTQLQRLGGKAAKMGKDKNGNAIERYCYIATTDTLFSLEQDSDYKTFQVEAGVRGDANYIFGGGFTDVRGNIIKKYNPIDHDGYGAVGSPLNPKAFGGNTTTDGFTTEGFILGGGSAAAAALTGKAYYKYFPLASFKFLATDTLLPADSIYGAGDFYVAVVNSSNAPLDAGKIGLYEISANNGNKLTAADKLVVADNAADAAWAGSPAWDASVHTNNHTVGSYTVYLVNASGVPLGHTLVVGAQAARRGYGKHRNSRTEDSHEGGFVKDIFVTSVFGQEPCEDAAGRKVGYLIITHAVQIAGAPFPTVA